MSRIVPNSYQTPNLYTDRLMALLSGEEWKTLHYALRRTFGFNRERDRISVSQFMNGNGRLDEAGRPLEYGTGLSHGAQLDAIQNLMRFGVLVEVAGNNRENHGRLWEMNLDESRIRFDLMEERRAQAEAVNRRRTAKARQAVAATRDAVQTADVHTPVRPALSPARRRATQERAGRLLLPVDNSDAAEGGLWDRPAMVVCGTDRGRSVGQTGGGLWDRPGVVCGTDTQKHSKKPSGNTEETHSERGHAASAGAAGKGERRAGAAEKKSADEGVVIAWRELVALCDGDEAEATAVWRLQERFAVVTRLKRPDPATAAGRATLRSVWWPHLRQTLTDAEGDPAAAEGAMQEAVALMVEREQPLNVVSPRSIVNVAASVLARQRRGNSGPRVQAQAARPKGFAGIDAYVERRGGARGN
jgi:hypothetical protein